MIGETEIIPKLVEYDDSSDDENVMTFLWNSHTSKNSVTTGNETSNSAPISNDETTFSEEDNQHSQHQGNCGSAEEDLATPDTVLLTVKLDNNRDAEVEQKVLLALVFSARRLYTNCPGILWQCIKITPIYLN